MRKTVIILSILILVGSDYIQPTKKQEATNTNEAFATFNNTNENQPFNVQKIDSAKYFALKEKTSYQISNSEI